MAELKTKLNDDDPLAFLESVEDEKKRQDAYEILEMLKKISGKEPRMWGGSIIGFGNYHYKYDSGREGDWFLAGFSPRKQNFSLYIMSGFDRYNELLKKLGKYQTGKACLYIKKLEDVDRKVLYELMEVSYQRMNAKYNG